LYKHLSKVKQSIKITTTKRKYYKIAQQTKRKINQLPVFRKNKLSVTCR